MRGFFTELIKTQMQETEENVGFSVLQATYQNI
mgnify:CR=1 FL=1